MSARSKIRIVILDKGFVSVGVTSVTKDFVTIEYAAVVRYWGTTRGLGEIAENGPTAATKLDRTPRQTIPLHSVVKIMDCVPEKWATVLGVQTTRRAPRAGT